VTAPAPTQDTTSHDDDLFHWVCECDWNIALCGIDVSGQTYKVPTPSDPMCVVCDDLMYAPCPRCGNRVDD